MLQSEVNWCKCRKLFATYLHSQLIEAINTELIIQSIPQLKLPKNVLCRYIPLFKQNKNKKKHLFTLVFTMAWKVYEWFRMTDTPRNRLAQFCVVSPSTLTLKHELAKTIAMHNENVYCYCWKRNLFLAEKLVFERETCFCDHVRKTCACVRDTFFCDTNLMFL